MTMLNKKIKVYSSPGCAYCYTLKEFLKKRDIEFEEIDIYEDKKAKEEMIKKSGQMNVPVMEIGENIVVGFDREKISELLGIK